MELIVSNFFFFFNDTATTEIYTLSLHDALPIHGRGDVARMLDTWFRQGQRLGIRIEIVAVDGDRKSTRLNSSHGYISYAVFCLKKKKKIKYILFHEKKNKKKKTI